MTLRNNDTQTLKLSMKTVQRFNFILHLLGAGTIANVALDLINVKCILRRSGREEVLFHEPLNVLALESSFLNGFEHAFQKTPITIAATKKMLPITIDLGSPLNLMGSDELRLEVTSKTGWYADFDANTSSIEIEERDSIGVETVIPFIRSLSIKATENRVVESLGDNITSIMLMNTEPTRTNSDADRVYDSMIITSDKYNASDNKGRLLARRALQFQTVADGNLRGENFVYVPQVELDGVQLTLELNAANNAAGKNFIVYRTYRVTGEVLQRSATLKNKHRARNINKLAAQATGS